MIELVKNKMLKNVALLMKFSHLKSFYLWLIYFGYLCIKNQIRKSNYLM